MATSIVDPDRDIIPRWRDFRTTIALGELDNASGEVGVREGSKFFTGIESKILAWKMNPSMGVAADPLNSAYLLHTFEPEVVDAARYLSKNKTKISPPLLRIVGSILRTEESDPPLPVFDLRPLHDNEVLYEKIHSLRSMLSDQPRNTILYVELARIYVLLHQNDQAKRAMLTAIKLSPNNRFVLRSAARLFIHIHEHGLAHNVLRRSERTKFDSWLLAAEIGVASAVGHSARFLSLGARLLKSRELEPMAITELATAVAMQEIEHGKNKEARRLIQQAMISPTENSLAQLAWISRNKIPLSNIESERFDNVPLVHESRAWEYYQDQNWQGVKQESLRWHYDQPFSSRPVSLAGYVASTIEKKYEEAIAILERGRRINPKNFTVLNNLAFSYASNDQPERANDALSSIDAHSLSPENRIYLAATRGLIAFREEESDKGRFLYMEAIEGAVESKNRLLATRALIFLTREEIRHDQSIADKILPQTWRLVKETKDKGLEFIAERHLGPAKELET